MPSLEPRDLPSGWCIWNHEAGGRIVLAFRPDVFNAETFPPACLPTIVVAPGRSPDDPPERRDRSEAWHVTGYLEPDVRLQDITSTYETRDGAINGALDVADRFTAGEIDIETAYQVPRDAYLTRLSEILADGRKHL